MNTLNNQQINPGNRVDFSRIRKYQNPSAPLTARRAGYGDWSSLLRDSRNIYRARNMFNRITGYYIKHNNHLYYIPNAGLNSLNMLDVVWVNAGPLNELGNSTRNGIMQALGIIKTADGKYIWSSAANPRIYSEIGTDGKFRYSRLDSGDFVADDGSGTQVFDPRQGWTTPAVAPANITNPTNITGEGDTNIRNDTNIEDGGDTNIRNNTRVTETIPSQPVNTTRVVANEPIRVERTPGLPDDNADIESWFEGNTHSSETSLTTPPVTTSQGNTPPVTTSQGNTPQGDKSSPSPTKEYTPILPQIKPYEPAPMGNSHLGQIYANNINSLSEREKYALNIKTPKQLPLTYHAYTTSGYLQLQLLKLQLADERTKYLNSAMSNDIDKSMAAALKFELEVASQYNNAITNSMDQHILNSKSEAKNAAENTLTSLTTAANYNNAQDTLRTQLDANTREKYATLRAAEKAGYLLNLALSKATYNENENKNWKLHNDAVNHYIYTAELNKLQQLYRETMSWDNTMALVSGAYNKLQARVDEILRADLNNTEMKTISEAMTRKDIVALREALEATLLSEAQALLTALKSANPDAEEAYLKGKAYLDNLYNYIQTYSNRSYSNAILGGQGLDYNLSTVFPDYVQTKKKGGKLTYEDRLLKYLEHNRKVREESNKNLRHSATQAEKRLLRDLDALDRETLLLLRSIFK